MKTVKVILLIALLSCGLTSYAEAQQIRQSTLRVSPRTHVSNLYKQHQRQSPFFQTRSRALVDKYFDRTLANLIWQEARSTRGEVGVLNADPLYNAQDTQIKNFALRERMVGSNAAEVVASFMNFTERHQVIFKLVPTRSGWRVSDIVYDDGSTLREFLKDDRGSEEQTQTVKIYLIALNDNGKAGKKIGCEDSVVPVTRTIRKTTAPLTAALNELLTAPGESNGNPKLDNFWKGRNLKLRSASISGNTATINITGEIFVAGVCDMPRIESQIEETARQFQNVKRVRVFVGNQTLRNAIQ